MKTLIIYDSFFGNTEKIAFAIAKSLTNDHSVETHKASDFSDFINSEFDILILGSPTRGFKATPLVQAFIDDYSLKPGKPMAVAVFDTRIKIENIKQGFFRYIVKKGGFAADKMMRAFSKKQIDTIVAPEGFYVIDKEGPLEAGEEQRAENWAQTILENYTRNTNLN